MLRSELAVIEKQSHHHPAQKNTPFKGASCVKIWEQLENLFFNMHTLHNLDKWTTMKKLVEYPHNIGFKNIGL